MRKTVSRLFKQKCLVVHLRLLCDAKAILDTAHIATSTKLLLVHPNLNGYQTKLFMHRLHGNAEYSSRTAQSQCATYHLDDHHNLASLSTWSQNESTTK